MAWSCSSGGSGLLRRVLGLSCGGIWCVSLYGGTLVLYEGDGAAFTVAALTFFVWASGVGSFEQDVKTNAVDYMSLRNKETMGIVFAFLQ